jgi:hypothetical protein
MMMMMMMVVNPEGANPSNTVIARTIIVTPQTCALDDVTPSDRRFADALPPDPLYEHRPGFQADQIGRLVLDDVTDADEAMSYFRGLFPHRMLSTCFPAMNEELQDAKGMPKITDGLFIGFIGVLILMSLVDLPSRKLYWDSSIEFLNADAFQESIPHHVFEKILQVVWKHLPRYAPGDLFLDGRACTDQDRLQAVRKWYDAVFEYTRQNFRASPLLVIDETMLPRKGPGPHFTHISRKPCELGVMWRSLCCAVTCVMVSGEFVEEVDVQAGKEGATLYGKTAATTFHVTRLYHDKSRRILIGDAWFGSLRTAHLMRQAGLFSIFNVKNGSKGFPKKGLLAAVTEEGKLVRKKRAYATVDIDVSGHMQTFLAAIHVDKQPMALVGTTGGSAEALAVSRRRRHWDSATHNVINWVGTLQQPRIHQLYQLICLSTSSS